MTKKTIKKKLEDRLWKLCMEYIRLRDAFRCQKCGKVVRGQGLHTSHVYCKKTYRSMKYDEQNLKCLCFYCHKWWHNNPLESFGWFKDKFPERFEYLERRKVQLQKLTLYDLDNLIDEYACKIQDLKIGKEITHEMS